jgi:hypothetical protein
MRDQFQKAARETAAKAAEEGHLPREAIDWVQKNIAH